MARYTRGAPILLRAANLKPLGTPAEFRKVRNGLAAERAAIVVAGIAFLYAVSCIDLGKIVIYALFGSGSDAAAPTE